MQGTGKVDTRRLATSWAPSALMGNVNPLPPTHWRPDNTPRRPPVLPLAVSNTTSSIIPSAMHWPCSVRRPPWHPIAALIGCCVISMWSSCGSRVLDPLCFRSPMRCCGSQITFLFRRVAMVRAPGVRDGSKSPSPYPSPRHITERIRKSLWLESATNKIRDMHPPQNVVGNRTPEFARPFQTGK
jgi:hypothetical protein